VNDFVNTRGQGSLGTATNNPVGDGNTMARTQNRASAPNGVTADSGIPGVAAAASGVRASGLSESDREFIREIHTAKHLDGTPFTLEELLFMRAENVRYQEQALRELGPSSSTVGYFREVIAAYDERIAEAKTPMGSAINGLKTVLVDPAANENQRREKIGTALGVMRQEQLSGQDNDPQTTEALDLIGKIVKRDAKEKNDALKALVDKEKRFSGSVSEDDFKAAIAKVMGIARQEQLLGVDDGNSGTSSGLAPVVETINLVADRRVASLKDLIAKEKRSPGSVSEQQFTKLVQAVLGDEREKQLLGVSNILGNGMEPVLEVMKLMLQRRRDAIDELFKKQRAPGGGVTNAQINQALTDYEIAKDQALRIGLAVPNAQQIPDQDPQIESAPSQD
jgi:hypothetical protein